MQPAPINRILRPATEPAPRASLVRFPGQDFAEELRAESARPGQLGSELAATRPGLAPPMVASGAMDPSSAGSTTAAVPGAGGSTATTRLVPRGVDAPEDVRLTMPTHAAPRSPAAPDIESEPPEEVDASTHDLDTPSSPAAAPAVPGISATEVIALIEPVLPLRQAPNSPAEALQPPAPNPTHTTPLATAASPVTTTPSIFHGDALATPARLDPLATPIAQANTARRGTDSAPAGPAQIPAQETTPATPPSATERTLPTGLVSYVATSELGRQARSHGTDASADASIPGDQPPRKPHGLAGASVAGPAIVPDAGSPTARPSHVDDPRAVRVVATVSPTVTAISAGSTARAGSPLIRPHASVLEQAVLDAVCQLTDSTSFEADPDGRGAPRTREPAVTFDQGASVLGQIALTRRSPPDTVSALLSADRDEQLREVLAQGARPNRLRLVVGEAADRVVVDVALRGGNVAVNFRAQDEATAAALARNASLLGEAMHHRGLRLADLVPRRDADDSNGGAGRRREARGGRPAAAPDDVFGPLLTAPLPPASRS